MSKTIHDENCDCVVCSNDYLSDRVRQLQDELMRTRKALETERKANSELSQYESAKGALLDVAKIKQSVAKQCIGLLNDDGKGRKITAYKNGRIKAIELEFGL